jgi:hypothetical protein
VRGMFAIDGSRNPPLLLFRLLSNITSALRMKPTSCRLTGTDCVEVQHGRSLCPAYPHRHESLALSRLFLGVFDRLYRELPMHLVEGRV